MYYNVTLNTALSISPYDVSEEELCAVPSTLEYSKLVFWRWKNAIDDLMNHRADGEFSYYFEWFGEQRDYTNGSGSLWMWVHDEDNNTLYDIHVTK